MNSACTFATMPLGVSGVGEGGFSFIDCVAFVAFVAMNDGKLNAATGKDISR